MSNWLGRKCCCQVTMCDQHLFGQVFISVLWFFFFLKKSSVMDVKIFLSSSPDEHMVPNSSQKQSVLETIIQSNLKQVLFLHYQAINWARGIRVCAQPQQSHFSHSCCSLMTPYLDSGLAFPMARDGGPFRPCSICPLFSTGTF